MKKFLYSVFMLAAVVLAACSNDDNGDIQPKRGMTLNASVEDLSSRATMTDESGTWKFAFAANDKVSVSNSEITSYYTFKNNGNQFTCADATATTKAADWYAYFPGDEVDLTNQTGNFADVANKFAVAGKTAQTTTGEKGLSITLKPKVAVLRVVAVDKKGILDIHVKTADKWVKGLTATKDAAEFTVSKSDTKTTLLHKEAGTVNAGEMETCPSIKPRTLVLLKVSTTPSPLVLLRVKPMPLSMARRPLQNGYSCGLAVQDSPQRMQQRK